MLAYVLCVSVAAIACASIASINGTSFPTALAGNVATGTCISGYAQGAAAPTLACDAAGNWAATITNPCIRTSVCVRDALALSLS